MIAVRYSDLVARAKQRPPGYLEDVLRHATRTRMGDLIISEDAYFVLREKYAAWSKVVTALNQVKSARSKSVLRRSNRQIVVPSGMRFRKPGCCGKAA